MAGELTPNEINISENISVLSIENKSDFEIKVDETDNSLIVETAIADIIVIDKESVEVISIAEQGPKGAKGDKGDKGDKGEATYFFTEEEFELHGSNFLNYTLLHKPALGSVSLFLNGIRQRDYSVESSDVVFNPSHGIYAGDVITISYYYTME